MRGGEFHFRFIVNTILPSSQNLKLVWHCLCIYFEPINIYNTLPRLGPPSHLTACYLASQTPTTNTLFATRLETHKHALTITLLERQRQTTNNV